MKLNIFQWRSLKTRVTFFTLCIFLIGIWSLEYFASQILRDDMERLCGEQQFSAVSMVAADINQEIDFRLRALEKIATGITPSILGNSAAMQEFLENRMILQSLFNAGCFVTRNDGTATASIPLSADRTGVNFIERDHVAAALKEGKTTVSKPVIGKMLHSPVVSMAAPIRDANNRIIGSVVGVIDLSKPNFLNMITDNRYGRSGGYVLIAPQHKLIVTATDKSRIMQTIPATGINPLMDRYIQGFEGSGSIVDSRGLAVLSAAKQIPVAGWIVVARITAEEAFSPIYKMQRHMLLATALLSLLTFGVTWWMLRRQLSPMLSAVETLSSISDSDLPITPLPIIRQDEVGQLIGGFNRLLHTLALRESALIESDKRHQSILHTAINGIWLVDMQGRLIEVNSSYCRMSGYSEQELLTMSISDLEVCESPDEVTEHLKLIKELGLVHFESQHRRKDGAVFDIEINVQYRSEDGGQFVAFVQDITERREAEKKIAASNNQLQQAQKMESVGSLAGGVAHDFNNKLSVILGYTYLADVESDPDELHKYLAEIRKAADQSADLTRQLLAFARKQTIAPCVLNLNETVTSMLNMLKRLIGEDIHLTWQASENLWPVRMDPSQIDQILANLCVNARDSIDGVGKISIETGNISIDEEYCSHHADVLSGEYVRLVVSDNGCGMDKKTLERIFEPFFTTKENGKGTGLGLATVFGIVKQNNGFINVTSDPGLGTTFSVYIPRHIGKARQAVKEVNAIPAARGCETILLVEDESAILNITATILKKQGYTVLPASSPAEAIRIVKEQDGEIHLLVTDVIMPGMNGSNLAHDLQSIHPSIKCLFMSGYTADVISRHGVLEDGVNFIHKPFSLPGIAAKVRDVLDSR